MTDSRLRQIFDRDTAVCGGFGTSDMLPAQGHVYRGTRNGGAVCVPNADRNPVAGVWALTQVTRISDETKRIKRTRLDIIETPIVS